MANINEILARAASLRDETALNSIDPGRAGGIMYDTLLALNELWLQQGAALVISKIYASVAAMNADTSPVSDLTGKPIRPGMIVVIASSDSDNGSVYRYNGTAAPRWSLVGSIGNVSPVDSLDSDSAQLPLAARQGKVLDGKISQLGQQVIYDVTANNDGAIFASLSALLSSENLSTLIPIQVRCGGMSIRFVQSSDNKYVQYRLMDNAWNAIPVFWFNVEDLAVLCNLPSAIFSEEGYISLTGVPYSGSNWRRTPFIPIDRSVDIVLTGIGGPSSCSAVAFYDEDKAFISSVPNTDIMDIRVVHKADIPSNASYIRSCTTVEYITHATKISCCSINGIAALQNELKAEFKEFVSSLNETAANYGNSIYTIPGFYVSKNNGDLVAFAAYNASDYIYLRKNADLTITGIQGDASVAVIAYYDADKNFISALPFSNVVGDTLLVRKEDYPNNATYIRTCCDNTGTVYANVRFINDTVYNILNESKKLNDYCIDSFDIFDYDSVLKMPRSIVRTMVESASNGAATVIWDDYGYPSMMYRIPKTSIASLAPTLGDYSTVHPAFVVNGVEKGCIYVAIYQTSFIDGHPVSWYGLQPSGGRSIATCKASALAKGQGWHLETIYERALICLLSAKYNGLSPRCNSYYGMSYGVSHGDNYTYEFCQRADGNVPGTNTFAAKWINGSQPNSWSHNGTRWGIFDIIGGFWEFCDLMKVVNGQVYLASDNNYSGLEENWIPTGAYIDVDTGHDNAIVLNTQRTEELEDIIIKNWNTVSCTPAYDTLDESIRKKLALLLIVPRMSSNENAPIFNFVGSYWIKNNITCYPISGGAEEYVDSGFGKFAMAYPNTENHDNMGSRLCYIK